MIDLRPDQLQLVKSILQKYLPEHEVWAFGSRVHWTTRDYSDLDLVIISQTPLDFGLLGEIRDAFSSSVLPFKVDVIDWSTVSDEFRSIILKDYEILQPKPTTNPRNISKLPEVKLGSIAEIIMGQSPAADSYNTEGKGVPFINAAELGPYHPIPVQYTTTPQKMAKEGDILLCLRGPSSGKINIADRDYAIGRNIAALRHRQGYLYQHFLKTLLENHAPTLLSQATGSTYPNLTFRQLVNLPCKLPNQDQQKKIAETIRVLEKKTELNRQINATIENITDMIFESWFVKYEPVISKSTNQNYHLPKSVIDLFPNRLQMSELGEIPEGWSVSTIEEEVTLIDRDLSNKVTPDLGEIECINLVTPKEIADLSGPFLLKTTQKITRSELQQPDPVVLPAETLLFSRFSGHIAISEIPATISHGIIGFICNRRLPYSYVYYWLKTCRNQFHEINPISFPGIRSAKIQPYPILVPPDSILKIFHGYFSLFRQKYINNLKQNEMLTEIKTSVFSPYI